MTQGVPLPRSHEEWDAQEEGEPPCCITPRRSPRRRFQTKGHPGPPRAQVQGKLRLWAAFAMGLLAGLAGVLAALTYYLLHGGQ